ncbi:anti-dorsalizing morphogenic protein precursor [Nasonia vitripennis]|uniref:TGF-beta family profile domain-containing protein n=1 Tax=Nasonia vitripennis TaxID=7425 RepID=A0A7M6UHF9_NASVI|nr:anti-dorsalizing morphogenic protein precursor [Nasonia vitripennis]
MKERKAKMFAVALLLLAAGGICAMDIHDETEEELNRAWDSQNVQVNVEEVQGELNELRKQEALEKLKEILGIRIRGKLKEESRKSVPPQFMMELYNTVTDADGKTRVNNPYNAKVVRSFTEKDSSTSHFYVFNVSALEPNESVLEAELHLYRKRSSPKSMHPSVLSSPYYLIRVYQVLPDRSLDEPDLHRLLNVHYVGAYASGWQIFNVKQAVLSWMSGSPNLGLLVTATTIFGDLVTVEFSRRDDYRHDKQPILVLFNDDADTNDFTIRPSNTLQMYDNADELDENDEEELVNEEALLENEMTEEARKVRNKRHESSRKGQPEEVPDLGEDNRPVIFQRQKKDRRQRQRDENGIALPRRRHGFVSKRKSLEQTLTSMDVYSRAMLREQLQLDSRKESTHSTPKISQKRSVSHQFRVDESRIRRDAATIEAATECKKVETEPCAKRDLYVNFKDIGLTSIIAPEGYAAYQCRGHCKSPLSQEQKPTNHATIQGIMHKMNVAPNQDVNMPCCVPVNLSSISILYNDDERDGVVLKSYTDMAVVSCGCR